MNGRYRIICFEGNELVGKSSLKKQVELKTNFRHLCIDRMFITSIVYNTHKNRHSDLTKDLYEDLDIFIKTFDPLFVVLHTSQDIQRARFESRGDWYIKNVDELLNIEKIYEEVVSDLLMKYPRNFVLLLNDNEIEAKHNVEIIVNAVNKMIEV